MIDIDLVDEKVGKDKKKSDIRSAGMVQGKIADWGYL